MKAVLGVTKIEGALERLAEVQAEELPEDSRKQSIKAAVFGDPVPPRRIGRFVDLSLLGHGAMGTVRRAYDERLAREVAIKLVRSDSVAGHSGRILREAQALAQLSHPNVVQIYEVGQREGEMFIAMELVHGETLHQWQSEPRSWRECVRAYAQAGRGLAAAHAVGLVHRDFKPANCIRDEQGRVRVLDFGLARAVDPAQRPKESSDEAIPIVSALECSEPHRTAPPIDGSGTVLQQRFTEAKAVVGTIAYMAPEQYGGRAVDAKSDQFSFCVALYEALYGELPFSRDPRAVLIKMAGGVAVSPRFPAAVRVPRAVRRVLRRGLAGEPEARWGSMEALLRVLERSLRGAKIGLGTVIIAAVGSAALASWAFAPSEAESCERNEHSLEDVAGDARREPFRELVRGSGVAYADDTRRAVEQQLDGYMEDWQELSLDVCRTHPEPKRAEAVEHCLMERRDSLEQVVAQLSTGDATTLENAAIIVAKLRPVRDCNKPGAVELVRSGLEDLREIRGLVAGAEHHIWRDDFEMAKSSLHQARQSARRHGFNEVELEAELLLSHIDGVERGRTAEGRLWLDVASPLVDRPQTSARLRSYYEQLRGDIAYSSGEYEQAKIHHLEALAILEGDDEYGDEHLLLAGPLDSLALSLLELGDSEGAAQRLGRVSEIFAHHLGEKHPSVVRTQARIDSHEAVISYGRADYERAHTLLVGSLASLEAAGLSGDSDFAEAKASLGALLEQRGDYAEAEATYRGALEIWRRVQGATHPLTLETRLSLARVLMNLGRHDESVAEYELIINLRGEPSSRALELAARASRDLGIQYFGRGMYDEADQSIWQGLALLEANGAPHGSTMASLLAQGGKVANARGEAKRAVALFERSLEVYRHVPDAARSKVDKIEEYRAQALAMMQSGEGTMSPPVDR